MEVFSIIPLSIVYFNDLFNVCLPCWTEGTPETGTGLALLMAASLSCNTAPGTEVFAERMDG